MTRRSPRPRTAYAAFVAQHTRWNDTDRYGHLYQGVYAELFDGALNDWLLDHDMLSLTGGEPCIVVAENGFSYFAELSYPDRPEIGIRLERLGGASATIAVGMFRPGSDEECAQGFFTVVNVDPVSHRPKPWADAHRAALQELLRAE